MPINIRPADPSDLDTLSDLMLEDATQRHATDAALWKLDESPRAKIRSTIKAAMQNEAPPFRQQWLIAEIAGQAVGVAHSILLPVPPIYAGEFGPPGLIMEDCFVSSNAPDDTRSRLLEAAEADLTAAGAKILLASSVVDGPWEGTFGRQGYAPLTKYLAKSGLSRERSFNNVRPATQGDVPAIVRSSATHRQVLVDLHELFWKPHADADARFGAWMARSLTLGDRDMFVSEPDGEFRGYAISHPATPLHFPTAHDCSSIGVIDDYYHDELEDPEILCQSGKNAAALLEAAEAARAGRGNSTVLAVCPAAWTSKIELLEKAGYRTAITWYILIP